MEDAQPEEVADAALEAITEMEEPEAFDRLRRDLVMALQGRMNPGALLAEAQRIADLDVALKVDVQPTIDGGVRFDLVDLPEGLKAGLELKRSAKFASVLAMELQYDPAGPLLLEGAYRQSPTLGVQVWGQEDGKATNMVLSVDFRPDHRQSRNAGLDLGQGETIVGLSYHLDIADPSKSSMRRVVMRDGLMTDDLVPVQLYGEPWPRMDKVQHFHETLLARKQALAK